ncbi:oxidoreductase [Mycobacterium dioxanotrophicus]|uniref:Oxidoreductase n=1 Tax=Mycobacterium dioxanotrophicus TaxID=482462 RepID=A0A1Y0BXP0_9MYCO|nr:PDR/VanB family oxidoreductase [Mycobacterium dioxanotrophicus]ART67654.1 oxidoreductase [Mycobacterium dioxanotrophicus]
MGVGVADQPAVVRQLRLEADGVVSVSLTRPDGLPWPAWAPGAHVDIVLPTGITRQYSLCGSPDDRDTYRIAVRRQVRSRGGSEYVHAFLRPGQNLAIRGPRNNFPLREHDRYLFIAGGIGITPILAMVRETAERGKPWRLLYAGSSAAGMAFTGELAELGGVVECYVSDRCGRIPLDDLLSEPRVGTGVYACGPETLLTAIAERMTHWPPGALHIERFASRPKPTRPDTEFDVRCARSAKTVTVPPGQSILDALVGAGVPVTASCREGLCGTCETAVLDGTPDHRDDILDERERAANDRMFICVSRAVGPRLELDI